MDKIILQLLTIIQYQYSQICWLVSFIARYIPLRQWAYDDSHSPKYQKFKTDTAPRIEYFEKKDWHALLRKHLQDTGRPIRPIRRRSSCDIPSDTVCPCCGAPAEYLYRNNGKAGQLQCKACGTRFSPQENRLSRSCILRCPFCGHALEAKKNRRFFILYKCVNPKCSYYLNNLKKVDKDDLDSPFGKDLYKLHYIYRAFNVDFFRMNLNSLPRNASSLKFRKFDSYVMSLCLTMHVNLGLSLRTTAQALLDLYGIHISHQMVADYARTAALVVKPFVDSYDYMPSSTFSADETYIRVRGKKSFVWLIMEAASRSILGYRASGDRSVGPCIMAMRMAFRLFRKIPENFRFIADGYSVYPLAAQQFFLKYGEDFRFDITQVLGLTNDDAVSKEFRPYKQLIERLNRTFKQTYRVRCGYDNLDGANCDLSLWVAYYNFLRPHQYNGFKVLNRIDQLENAGTMPGKWQILIYLGQQRILQMQKESSS